MPLTISVRNGRRAPPCHLLGPYVTPLPATTPWIALIACDANTTNASQDVDVFTLASDRGAVGAVRVCFLMLTSGGRLTRSGLAPLLRMGKSVHHQSRIQRP